MHSVRRTSNTHSKGCFVKKFYDLPGTNLSHTEECPEYGHSSSEFKPQSGCYVEAAGYELVEQYLDGLLPELNFRLFCDVEPESGYFPQTMLWVEKITMLHEEEGTSVCGREEKYCLGGRPLKGEKEAVFSEQIKYMLEKMINDFKTLWKKKGR